jgi:hypothetical protein
MPCAPAFILTSLAATARVDLPPVSAALSPPQRSAAQRRGRAHGLRVPLPQQAPPQRTSSQIAHALPILAPALIDDRTHRAPNPSVADDRRWRSHPSSRSRQQRPRAANEFCWPSHGRRPWHDDGRSYTGGVGVAAASQANGKQRTPTSQPPGTPSRQRARSLARRETAMFHVKHCSRLFWRARRSHIRRWR